MLAPNCACSTFRERLYVKNVPKTLWLAVGLRFLGVMVLACMLSTAKGKPAGTVASNSMMAGTANTTAESVQTASMQQRGPGATSSSDEQAIYMLIGTGLLAFSFLTRQLSRRRKIRNAHSAIEEFHSVNSKSP